MKDEIGPRAFGSARITAPRRAIAAAVERLSGAFTVDDLAHEVRRTDPRTGATATIYRAVAAMEQSGFIECVGAREGASLYVRCTADHHHHHIVCDGCGRTEAAECPVSAFESASQASGFVVKRHEVTLYGLCPDCAKTERR